MTGPGYELGRQRPPDRCKRRMNSHSVNCLGPWPEPPPATVRPRADTSPHAHASSGWGEAPLYIQPGQLADGAVTATADQATATRALDNRAHSRLICAGTGSCRIPTETV